jgi:SAM-dependent methyltransferase
MTLIKQQILSDANWSEYFEGNKLYGDDFTLSEITQWYNDEAEAYANLGSKDRDTYLYEYHNQNILNGFKYFKDILKFNNVLGIGSAYGDEFLPIIDRINKLTILEPSDTLKSDRIGSITPTYLKPNIDGSLNFADETFDLIICFGVLLHIPNVTYVFKELLRVLSPGGVLLLKEPINSMGDWREKRKGLTKNERGISLSFFNNIFKENNVEVVSISLIDTFFIYKVLSKFFKIDMTSRLYVKFDKILSFLLSWNIHYHRKMKCQKIGPGAVFYVLRKSK